MNVIDVFRALGMYDNKPQLKSFFLAFKKAQYVAGKEYRWLTVGNGVVHAQSGRSLEEGPGSSGIFFYMIKGVGGSLEGHFRDDASRFNNFWPDHGGTGEIDVEETIRATFEGDPKLWGKSLY
jgi:hypothetical protein